jgi:hypothetical protein
MAASADGVKCSWCSSGAVGSACYPETDAKSLPTSIFYCKYQSVYHAKPMSCDDYTSTDTCNAGEILGDRCVWCEGLESALAPSGCYSSVDASHLPTEFFTCSKPGINCDSQKSSDSCLSTTTSEGIKCAWCKSEYTGEVCYEETVAKPLPSYIFQCKFQQGFGLRGTN